MANTHATEPNSRVTYEAHNTVALAIVHWQTKDGKRSGHGKPIDAQAAGEHVLRANAKYPDIHHWAEPVTALRKE